MLGDRPKRLRVYALANGRAIEQVSCDGMTRLDGRPAVDVQRYAYDDAGRLASVSRVSESGSDPSWGLERGPYWRSTVARFTYGSAGRLVLVERFANAADLAHGGDQEAAFLATARWLERGDVEPEIVFDEREPARERELPTVDAALTGPGSELPDAAPPDARVEPAALAAWLTACGLGDYTEELMRRVEPGLRLTPIIDECRGRLGGPVLLPPGMEWPHTSDGRPLAFLAGIDLGEMSSLGALPNEGWMLFYADTGTDELGGPLVEPAPNEEGSRARMWYVGPPDAPVPADTPPAVDRPLRPAWVEGSVQLTLPDDYVLSEELGFDDDEEELYGELTGRLRYGDSGWSPEVGAHWILGTWTNVQGHPRDEDSVLLLHLASDKSIGFEFLGGGALQFLISKSELDARDWSAVVAEPGLP